MMFYPHREDIEIESQIIKLNLNGSTGLDITLNIASEEINSERTF